MGIGRAEIKVWNLPIIIQVQSHSSCHLARSGLEISPHGAWEITRFLDFCETLSADRLGAEEKKSILDSGNILDPRLDFYLPTGDYLILFLQIGLPYGGLYL